MTTEERTVDIDVDGVMKKIKVLPNGTLEPMECVREESERFASGQTQPDGVTKRSGDKSSANRWKLLNDFIDGLEDFNLEPLEIACWLILFRHADKKNIATVSQSLLADTCHRDGRSIRRALRRLIDGGWLRKRSRRGALNRYTILVKSGDKS